MFQALKDSEIKTAKGNPVKVSKSKPDFIRTRDWAMGKSEELIKAKLETAKISATVKFEKGKEVRRITVNGCDAFVQRFATPEALLSVHSMTLSCLRAYVVAQTSPC